MSLDCLTINYLCNFGLTTSYYWTSPKIKTSAEVSMATPEKPCRRSILIRATMAVQRLAGPADSASDSLMFSSM